MIAEKYIASGVVALLVYIILKAFFKQQRQLLAYQKEMHRILTDKQYKVKGRNE